MIELYRAIAERTARGETMALATVVRVKGSTPREAGAKMAVGADGRIVGTVGGGCGESQVWEAAREVLRTGQPRLVHVDLTAGADPGGGDICGGTMDVFVEPVPARLAER